MEFLRMLASVRVPWLDGLMSAVTLLGSEALLLALALYVFWCRDRRDGYYMLTVCFSGLVINQFLKIACRVPRPWVRDPALTIVESARAGATGYSFPSGHTQNITGLMGVVALTQPRRWLRWLCAAAVALVGFSRMYLGVHTPADVLTSLTVGLALVFGLRPLMRWAERKPNRMGWLLLGMLGLALAFLGYTQLARFPVEVDPVNLAEARKNAWTMAGAVAGVGVGWLADRRADFPRGGVWWAQLLKTAIGLGLVLGVKEGLKPLLAALFGAAAFTHGIRYFCCVLVATALWPLSFRFFARLGRR